ncbi:hypothetical protein ACQV2L_22960, partial [Pantoea allii]|uniref:hypothetical protein n=1 Tax=Pantoea allii TaxID=574096 RepID=UPI003D31D454
GVKGPRRLAAPCRSPARGGLKLPAARRAKPSQSYMTERRSGWQPGSPGSRGRGDWRPLVGRPHGAG